ncbi:MAG: hypothetical protein KAV83_04955 [Desulfobacterales bacterium]|nr:hypothetical protein [Desulfobacterales bacterium]
MKKLIYLPIIHMSADLGTIAKQVDKRGIAGLGEEFWKRHRETISGFWESIVKYFADLEVKNVKIYQDGLVVGGEVGQKIVEEAVKAGSKNYEIIDDLLRKGAILVQTEDFALVKEERDRIVKITTARTTTKKLIGHLWYKFTKNRLLNKRDTYIAKKIDETLNDGETGILFIGAYHNIIPKLSKNIQVTEVRETKKVRDYQRLLLHYRKNKEEFEELAKYLVSPVN